MYVPTNLPPVTVHLTIVYPSPLVVLASGHFYVMLCYDNNTSQVTHLHRTQLHRSSSASAHWFHSARNQRVGGAQPRIHGSRQANPLTHVRRV